MWSSDQVSSNRYQVTGIKEVLIKGTGGSEVSDRKIARINNDAFSQYPSNEVVDFDTCYLIPDTCFWYREQAAPRLVTEK
jgi:hypothetical protein